MALILTGELSSHHHVTSAPIMITNNERLHDRVAWLDLHYLKLLKLKSEFKGKLLNGDIIILVERVQVNARHPFDYFLLILLNTHIFSFLYSRLHLSR